MRVRSLDVPSGLDGTKYTKNFHEFSGERDGVKAVLVVLNKNKILVDNLVNAEPGNVKGGLLRLNIQGQGKFFFDDLQDIRPILPILPLKLIKLLLNVRNFLIMEL